MTENVAAKRIVKVASELGVGVEHVIDFLQKSGHKDVSRNSKVTEEQYVLLLREFQEEKSVKEESKLVFSGRTKKDSMVLEADEAKPSEAQKQREEEKNAKGVSYGAIITSISNYVEIGSGRG